MCKRDTNCKSQNLIIITVEEKKSMLYVSADNYKNAIGFVWWLLTSPENTSRRVWVKMFPAVLFFFDDLSRTLSLYNVKNIRQHSNRIKTIIITLNISLNVVPGDPVDNEWALIRVMPWRRYTPRHNLKLDWSSSLTHVCVIKSK